MIEDFPTVFLRVPACDDGWLCHDVQGLLSRFITDGTLCIIEVGSWMGRSTRWMLDRAPAATVYCVDHWQGSREHQHAKHVDKLPTLFETFLSSCWEYRSRIKIVKESSRVGLPLIAAAGVVPNLIYIDGSHEYHDVLADIADAVRLFPGVPIVGDDWNWQGVRLAVVQSALNTGRAYEHHGKGWCMP